MRTVRHSWIGAFLFVALVLPSRASALDRLCDPSFENCRSLLIDFIRKETVGIDVGFWFMEDSRYANELIAKHRSGVPVRVIFDQRAYTENGYSHARYPVELMRDAGIPMRQDVSGGIFHFKMMLFAGQGQIEFSGANYSSNAFVPNDPYRDYVDEVIMFTDDPSIVNSFKTRYDDTWTSTTGFSSYANAPLPLQRHYPTYPIDPELLFVPWQNFRTRSVSSYKAEPRAIDAIMYRITDRAHTDELIRALGRGVGVRLITEPQEYRNPTRLWHSWNVERLLMAGAEVKMRTHLGLNHEKLTVLHGQELTILGSSNWTSASATGQHEHNLFTTRAWVYAWARDHFNRKWNNSTGVAENETLVPLPPDRPVLKIPAHGAIEQASTVTLRWYGGPWAHKYDVYLGTDPARLSLVLSDRELGPSETTSQTQQWSVGGLAAGTTYYWKVVSRTMANVSRESSSTFRFKTSGTSTTSPPPTSTLPAGWSNVDVGGVSAAGSASYSSGVYTVRGSGSDVWGTADELHYAYRTIFGDGSITARVDSVTNTNAWTKVGVMLRETIAANAKHAFMIVSPGKGLAFQRRTATGGTSTHTAGPMATAPYWVRLTRTGSTITAAVSVNGLTWTSVGTATISMGATIQAGLAVSSHVDGTVATASFSGVSIVD